MIKTTYPEYINEVAEHLGRLRNEHNNELRKKYPKYEMGNLNLYVDVLGVKGELILSNYLYSIGVEHELQILLDDSPVCSWDIKLGDTTFDVKTFEHPKGNFLVNEEQHHKKRVDYYAFVLPVENNNAYIWKYTYEQVSDWNVKHFGYANAYHKKVTYE